MTDTLFEQTRAALAKRYTLLSQIGRGGAATVYLAEDRKHERQVAVKVLRPDLAASLGEDRFLREIKIAANLSHPHVLPVHDSGSAGGFLYYVMPVVEGESLRQRLARERALSVSDTVRILHDVLDALHYAHTRGVVHRDIKPDNVMLSGRHALVTDFGVAKALSVAVRQDEGEGGDIDTMGVALGTPTYMAPEQATSDPAIDHRADIYSVGALTYELLTGRPPFRQESPRAVLMAQVTQRPIPVARHCPAVPPALEHIVMKCLEKEPNARWQSAEEMLRELEAAVTPSNGTTALVAHPLPRPARRPRWMAATLAGAMLVLVLAIAWFMLNSGASATPDRPTLVVLPFENLGPEEDEYFANGVTDAITARLASLGGVGVISRTSALQYVGTALTTRQIAAELRVDYVLEGTIQRERASDPTSRVRITPQLIRASDDTHVWADAYDEDGTEVFRVQSEIAERVARALDLTLLEPERRSLGARPTDNLEAYELYLRGHDYLEGNVGAGDANARRIAVDMFERAISLDPEFALAYAELSLAHIWLFHWFVDPTDRRLGLAKAALDSALALRPDLAKTQMALGYFHYWKPDPDRERALAAFEAVARYEPNNASARMLIAELAAGEGAWDEALANAALAVDLAPREPAWAGTAGFFHLLARRYAEAEAYLDRGLTIAPDLATAHRNKVGLYLRWRGDTARARDAVVEMGGRVTQGEVAQALVEVAPVLLVQGEHDAMFEELSPASVSGPLPFDYFNIKAEYYRLRKDPDRSRSYFDSLLTVVNTVAQDRASSPVVMEFRGRAYAGLGQKPEALSVAGLIEVLAADSVDVLRAASLRESLVWIYAMVGEFDAAVDHIEQLLSMPSLLSRPYLRLAEFPGRLKEHPRMQRLLEGSFARASVVTPPT